MNTNRLLMGTLAGGITAFLAGWLIYGMVMMSFLTANKGSATGVEKMTPDFLPLILSNLCLGLFFAYIFERWAGINTLAEGAKAGAIIGVIMGAGVDLNMLATTNLMTPTSVIADVAAFTIMCTIIGGVTGLVMGKVSSMKM